jgi:hypothetical protein
VRGLLKNTNIAHTATAEPCSGVERTPKKSCTKCVVFCRVGLSAGESFSKEIKRLFSSTHKTPRPHNFTSYLHTLHSPVAPTSPLRPLAHHLRVLFLANRDHRHSPTHERISPPHAHTHPPSFEGRKEKGDKSEGKRRTQSHNTMPFIAAARAAAVLYSPVAAVLGTIAVADASTPPSPPPRPRSVSVSSTTSKQ